MALCRLTGIAQTPKTISLKNPSFEDIPHLGKMGTSGPEGWFDCGFDGETAPDIHPDPHGMGFFEVTKTPSNGKTYVGMVVRDNKTWEAIGQRLSSPLIGGQCYEMSIDLARSERYYSISRMSKQEVNYKRAAVLRVFGSNRSCGNLELLDETEPVKSHQWRTYNLRLEPARNYTYILLQVFYKTSPFEYNGNMLLDNVSKIVPVPCDEALKPPTEEIPEQLASNNPPNQTKTTPKPPEKTNVSPKPSPPKQTAAAGKPPKKKKEYVKELDEKVVVGQEITLKNLYFDADSSVLEDRYFHIIDDVYHYLIENDKAVIEVGGHTNNRCETDFCNRLSEARAKSVANYLIDKGIADQRVQFKGYGKMKQKYPNNTPTNVRRNQRVEIKILSLNG